MIHSDVFKIFVRKFPVKAENCEMYFPNGYNSIRIRFKNKKEIVFSYNDPSNWVVQSIDEYIKCMRERNKLIN